MAYRFFVYVLASKSGVLYLGVTNDLEYRLWQHKRKRVSGFTERYNVDRLMHYEEYGYIDQAIAREKELKGWRRARKVELFQRENPLWEDLAEDWTCFDEYDAAFENEIPRSSG